MRIYIYLVLTVLFFVSGFTQSSHSFAYLDSARKYNLSAEIQDQSDDIIHSGILINEVMLIDAIMSSEDSSYSVLSDTIPWHKIDLGSPLMKKKSSAPFRWWIPATIAGGAIGIAGAALILSSGNSEPPDSSIFAMNDHFTAPCKVNTSFFPLLNDIGEDLRIISISGAPSGWVTFTDQSIQIQESASQNFTFIYTITDNKGEQASASISVTIEFSAIQLQSPSFQGRPGDLITHQLFINSICSDCIVTNVSATPISFFNWTPSGDFSFQIPVDAIPQTILFTVVVNDRCMQTGTAQISVTVGPDCDIEPSFIVNKEECDFKNGSIEVVIEPISNYRFNWNNGMSSARITGLAEGIYQLTLSLISNPECSDVFNVEVSSDSPELSPEDDRYQALSNVLLTGNVLTNDVGSQLRVTAFEDLDVQEFSIRTDGAFTFFVDENALNQYTSVYTVTDICGTTSTAVVQFDVAKLPCDFSAAITPVAADCGKENGSASVIVTPAGAPYEIKWPNGTTGTFASGFSAGTYNLVVTNTSNNCVLNFSFTIEEKPVPNYIQTIETSAATCIGGGHIDLVLNDPAGNIMQLMITRENMPFISANAGNGLIRLGEIANFLPGEYQISVSCNGCPARCAQIVNVSLSQISPFLEINDDIASIPTNTSWSGNVLLNDIGVGMNVVGFTQPSAGTASINPNGLAVYNPPAGYSGVVTFNYTVRDTCGQEKSAVVTINVIELPCDFSAQFSNTPADCGMMNGSSTVVISPAGSTYVVNWPDGSQGFSNTMLDPGNYTVTISNEIPGCTLMFSTIVTELPPLELIQQITTEAATCISGGTAAYTIMNPLPVDIVVEIYMNNQFLNSASISPFGSFIGSIGSLNAGNYLLQAQISNSPRRCADSDAFEIQVEPLPMNLMEDNFTIPFGTAWVGNVLLNDIGTGLQVSGNTTSSDGTVQILSDGSGVFIPNPGFSGVATFQYFARDVCNQEQKANVNITVLPFIGGINSENTSFTGSFEFFSYHLQSRHTAIIGSAFEGNTPQTSFVNPGILRGSRYNVVHKNWILRYEMSLGEASTSNGRGQVFYEYTFQNRLGLGMFYDFNRNRIIVESGMNTTFSKSLFSNSLHSDFSMNTFHALYLKAEYQIRISSGYSFFWEPQLFYWASGGKWNGMIYSGFKLILE